MQNSIAIGSLVLVMLIASAYAVSTRRTPDKTYTECYDDGSCAKISEWEYEYTTETTVDVPATGGSSVNWVDSGNHYNSFNSNTNTNTNINTNSASNNNANSANYAYNYNYYGNNGNNGNNGGDDGDYYYDYGTTTTTTTTRKPRKTTTQASQHHSGGKGSGGISGGVDLGVNVGAGSRGGRYDDDYDRRRHSGSLLGDIIRLPGEVVGGFADGVEGQVLRGSRLGAGYEGRGRGGGSGLLGLGGRVDGRVNVGSGLLGQDGRGDAIGSGGLRFNTGAHVRV